jgi:hypothetical protein
MPTGVRLSTALALIYSVVVSGSSFAQSSGHARFEHGQQCMVYSCAT